MRLGLDKPFALPPRSLQHSFRPCHCQAPPTIRTFERPNLLVESGRSFSMQFRPNLRLDLAVALLIQSSRRRMAHREGALQAGLIA